jgi:hypothetical protein
MRKCVSHGQIASFSIMLAVLCEACYAQVPQGDGIYDYTVATDYYYGNASTPRPPSLAYDLSQYKINKIRYVFPSFMYIKSRFLDNHAAQFQEPIRIGSVDNARGTPACPVPIANLDVFYFGMPLIHSEEEYISGRDPGVLGKCVDGYSLSRYYHNLPSNPYVLPNLEWDGSFPATLAASAPSAVAALADGIADTINGDPNVQGLAIDNEPALNSIAPALELSFFSKLATRLAGAGKFLFLFGASLNTAQTLYNNGTGFTNVVVLRPLYGDNWGLVENFNPVPYSNFQPYYAGQVASYLGNPANPPVMFVLPASATDEQWDYDIEYLNGGAQSNPTIPTLSANPRSGMDCTFLKRDPIAEIILKNILTFTEQQTLLSSSNCKHYNNPYPIPAGLPRNSTRTEAYFYYAMNAVERSSSPKLLGVALFAWKIPGQGVINGARSYSATIGIRARALQQEPSAISANAWAAYQNWPSWHTTP